MLDGDDENNISISFDQESQSNVKQNDMLKLVSGQGPEIKPRYSCVPEEEKKMNFAPRQSAHYGFY